MKRVYGLIFLMSLTCVAIAAKTSVHRGEMIFRAYCSGCHTLHYFSKQYHQVSMPVVEAEKWFGKVPPDLSLTTRARNKAWLSNYLKGFYPDQQRPFGANNHVISDVAMPNVLFPLEQNQQKFQATVEDLVAFLDYVAEPHRDFRYRLGFLVVSFLIICLLLYLYRFFTEVM